jgi:transcriptional regulator with XRE-family HTH domain
MISVKQILADLSEYQIPQAALARASGLDEATLSRWLRGAYALNPATAERVEETAHAMMNLTHYRFDLPIAWSRVNEFVPLIEKYRQEYVQYKKDLAAEEAIHASSGE